MTQSSELISMVKDIHGIAGNSLNLHFKPFHLKHYRGMCDAPVELHNETIAGEIMDVKHLHENNIYWLHR